MLVLAVQKSSAYHPDIERTVVTPVSAETSMGILNWRKRVAVTALNFLFSVLGGLFSDAQVSEKNVPQFSSSYEKDNIRCRGRSRKDVVKAR